MNIVSIYRITNETTGRSYIGQTSQVNGLHRRWMDHCKKAARGATTPLHAAIRQYGPDDFQVSLLMTCEPEMADFYEQIAISAMQTTESRFGFNVSPGGSNGNNVKPAAVREKISAASRGKKRGPMPESTKAKIAKSKLGKPRPEEVMRKLVQARRAFSTLPERWKENISKGLIAAAKFKLSDSDLQELATTLHCSSDAALSVRYGVSRKMLWRIRQGKHRRFNDLLSREHVGEHK